MPETLAPPGNDLDAFWMPFTPNRRFKAQPRMLSHAEGMHYRTPDGRQILDATSGLWCVNAGHNRPKIVEAIRRQAGEMDYAPSFNMGHPAAFAFASRIAQITPAGPGPDLLHRLGLGVGRHRPEDRPGLPPGARQGDQDPADRPRARLSRRRLRRHLGGRHPQEPDVFRILLTGVDHLPHTHGVDGNLFSQGQPKNGAELADALEAIVALHDASNIAAVIVEPVAGSTGVLVPPEGYLQRLRAICDKHDILLIFDEVITGFGRVGAAFAAERFGVIPDMICMAKGLTNAAVPAGAVAASEGIYQAMMDGADAAIELFHGYTYSAHPLACAAGLAALEVYQEEGLFSGRWRWSPTGARRCIR
jgi:beta-alanine--pyruvate transaminase